MTAAGTSDLRAVRGRWLFTLAGPPIEGGIVTYSTRDNRIVAVGPNVFNLRVEDLGDVAILPGLVNAHAHLEFSHLEKPLGTPGMSLPDWIRLVMAERGGRTAPADESIGRGLWECEQAQTALVCDISSNLLPVGESYEASLEPYVDASAGLASVVCKEAIGLREERVFNTLEKLYAWSGYRQTMFPDVGFGFSPHAPYSVHPRLLSEIATNLAAPGDVVAMHVAESREELELLQTGGGPFRALLEDFNAWDDEAIVPGSRPLDYLRLLAAADRSLVVHGNYLDDEEIELIAANRERMSVVYCPRTHAFFGHSPYPLQKLLGASINVALGTDSRSSNPDLDLWKEMQLVAAAHQDVSPEQILRMGTVSGAKALGREAEFGTLQVGRRAMFTVRPISGGEPYDLREVLS